MEHVTAVYELRRSTQWARAHFLFAGYSRRPATMVIDIEHVRQIAERVASDASLELVDVEFRGGGKSRMLRVYIDKPGGVTHQDCALVSREVGTILDVEDAVPGGQYVLEVSSPGLDRKLAKAADYERFTGSKLKLFTREPVNGSRSFEGRLERFWDGTLTLALESSRRTPGAGGTVEIALSNIEKANLVPEF